MRTKIPKRIQNRPHQRKRTRKTKGKTNLRISEVEKMTLILEQCPNYGAKHFRAKKPSNPALPLTVPLINPDGTFIRNMEFCVCPSCGARHLKKKETKKRWR